MTELAVEEQRCGPEDLREQVAPDRLLRLVLDAVQVTAELPGDGFVQRALPLGMPRTLLTVLTYSYAIGLYSSDEIEAELRKDPQLVYASAKATISATALRRFRRLHRLPIQRSLSAVLQQALGLRTEPSLASQPHDRDVNDTQRSLELLFAWAAERRVNRAVLADTIALDT